MRIVIPMSGMGNRFIRAGYSTPKTLLEAEGKPVIEHVVDMFPGEERFLFIINQEHDNNTNIRAVLERIAPKGEIVVIEPHKKGPVWATLQVIDRLDPDEPTIVNYCDFSVGWNYAHFLDTMQATDVAGCVTSYRGFHPHSLGSTLYAYMRTERGRVLEITEKAHFTDDRMQEYASSGTYYFSSGQLVEKYFQRLVERDIALNGEYYVSLVYNLLIEDDLPVSVYELDQFLQWGTPEDWQEYQSWSQHFAGESGWRPTLPPSGQVLVPMAGEGVRFREDGYEAPKPLIPVGDEHMVVRAARSLPTGETATFVVRQNLLDTSDIQQRLEAEFGAGTQVIGLDEVTDGQACTCLMARDHLDPDAPLTIGPCDSAVVWDEERFQQLVSASDVDAIIFTFRNHPDAWRRPGAYGWVEARNDEAVSMSVKKPISDDPQTDPGIVGAFWFRRAADFFAAADRLIEANERVNGEFYVDSCMGTMIEMGKSVRILDVDRYVCWGTPDDLRTWQYWERYFASVEHHPYERGEVEVR